MQHAATIGGLRLAPRAFLKGVPRRLHRLFYVGSVSLGDLANFLASRGVHSSESSAGFAFDPAVIDEKLRGGDRYLLFDRRGHHGGHGQLLGVSLAYITLYATLDNITSRKRR